MAYQVGSACYETPEAANAAAASSQVGAHLVIGGQVVIVDVAGVTASSITYSYTPVGGAASSVTVPATPPQCGLLGVDDALAIGWGIAAAVLGAYAVMFITRGLRDHGYT